MSKIIGIDLGTTNCCVAVLEGGTVQIVANKEGGRTTPSVVGFTDKGERLVGQIAKRQAVTNAANTVYAVKRLIGRKFDSTEARRMRETVPFEIVDSQNGDARIRVQGRVYSPPELSGIVLQRLKAAAEDFLGESVSDAERPGGIPPGRVVLRDRLVDLLAAVCAGDEDRPGEVAAHLFQVSSQASEIGDDLRGRRVVDAKPRAGLRGSKFRQGEMAGEVHRCASW